MITPVLTNLADAIVTTLAAGTFNGSPISATRNGAGGEVRLPATVVVASPSIGYEPLGEGFRVTSTDWLLVLYTAKGNGEPDLTTDLEFLQAVTEALADDVTLGGYLEHGLIAYPISSPRPDAVPIAGAARGKDRKMMRRELVLHIDH